LAALSQIAKLETLWIHGAIEADALPALQSLARLRSLVFHDTQFPHGGLKDARFPSGLEEIAIIGGNCPLDEAAAGAIDACPSLKSLNLSYSTVSDEQFRALLSRPFIERLERLDANDLPLSDETLELLKRAKKLTYLSLQPTPNSEAAVAALREALPNCSISWSPRAMP
jgi:hypothetical protein